MRNRIFTRPARQEDSRTFLDWSTANPGNGFDPEVARYPSTFTLCAYDADGPLAFMPVQRPLMLESLATRPGATLQQVARAIKEIAHTCVTQAHIQGAGEIYFLHSDQGTSDMAENQIFEKVPMSVYRVKLKDLER